MDSRIEGTAQMDSEGSDTGAVGSVGLDRAGRILVRLGSLVAVVLVALPILGLALFSLSFASLSLDWDVATLLELTLPATGIVVAVIVTIVMMLRGGTASLTLGGIGAFIVGAVARGYPHGQPHRRHHPDGKRT